MAIKFVDQAHQDFYKQMLKQEKAQNDPYRKPLFYLFGLLPETRKNIANLYDLREKVIIPEGLDKGWQTGTSVEICRLAFNLYNGYTEDYAREFTPYFLFANSYQKYMLEAIKLRYPEYA